jgi:hypothetical protein
MWAVFIDNAPTFPPWKTDTFDGPIGPWAKFFAPKVSESVPQCLIPNDWARFFTALLLSPSHFRRAKDSAVKSFPLLYQ